MTFKGIILLATVLLVISAQNDNQTSLRAKITSKCCEYNTITVYGSASLKARPDQAILQASITRNGATVAQAVDNLGVAVDSIISILNNNSLTANDYSSTGFNVYPNTSFINGTSNVIGQIAYQAFQINIPQIAPNGSNIGQLIDSLATVNGIVISGLTFDIKNKTQVYQIARQQAFVNAQDKANDYTDALDLTLLELLTLVDSFSSAPVVTPSDQNKFMSNIVTPTTVNVGAITISYSLQAVFRFK